MKSKIISLVLITFLTTLLVACGGGGGSTQIPASTTTTTTTTTGTGSGNDGTNNNNQTQDNNNNNNNTGSGTTTITTGVYTNYFNQDFELRKSTHWYGIWNADPILQIKFNNKQDYYIITTKKVQTYNTSETPGDDIVAGYIDDKVYILTRSTANTGKVITYSSLNLSNKTEKDITGINLSVVSNIIKIDGVLVIALKDGLYSIDSNGLTLISAHNIPCNAGDRMTIIDNSKTLFITVNDKIYGFSDLGQQAFTPILTNKIIMGTYVHNGKLIAFLKEPFSTSKHVLSIGIVDDTGAYTEKSYTFPLGAYFPRDGVFDLTTTLAQSTAPHEAAFIDAMSGSNNTLYLLGNITPAGYLPHQSGIQFNETFPSFKFSFLLKLDKDYNPVILNNLYYNESTWLGFIPNGGGNYTFAVHAIGYRLLYYNNSLNSVSREMNMTSIRVFEN